MYASPLFAAFLVILCQKSIAQCTSTGTNNSGITIVPCYGEAISSAVVTEGQYLTLHVVQGIQYEVKTCGASWNTALTIQDNSGNPLTVSSGTNFNNNSNSCGSGSLQSFLVFQAPSSGTVRVFLTRSNASGNNVCQTGGGNTSAITITPLDADNSSNTVDNAGSSGANAWTGHAYNRSDAGTQPSDANAFTRYVGYTSQAETFSENFGGSSNCFNVLSQSAAQIKLNSEYFAMRYRMQSSRVKGCYVADIRSDEGARLTVDGIKVFDRWIEQSATTYSKVFFNLNGNSSLLLEYYESSGSNEIGFSNLSRVSNQLTANTNQVSCQYMTPAAIGGNDVFADAPLSSDIRFAVTYQWQHSADSNTWSDISGATGQNHVPSDTTTGLHYYRRRVQIVKTNEAGIAVTGRDTTSAATLLVRPHPSGALNGNTICEGQQGQLTFTASSGTAPFSLVISGHTYNNVQSGIAFNPVPPPPATTNYQLTMITDNLGCIYQ